jgi:hypothetical protein
VLDSIPIVSQGAGPLIRQRNAVAPKLALITSEDGHPYDDLQSINRIRFMPQLVTHLGQQVVYIGKHM